MTFQEANQRWGTLSSVCPKCTSIGPFRMRYSNHIRGDFDFIYWSCGTCGVEVEASRTADHNPETCKRACCTV